jgi:hypothetical protein
MHWYGCRDLGPRRAAAKPHCAAFTRRWTPPLWLGWAILIVVVVFVYLLRRFFLR